MPRPYRSELPEKVNCDELLGGRAIARLRTAVMVEAKTASEGREATRPVTDAACSFE